jgi:protein with PEP-CTERM/exosortase system signal
MKRANLVLLVVVLLLGFMPAANAGFLPVPESGGTFILLGLSLVGLISFRRRLNR